MNKIKTAIFFLSVAFAAYVCSAAGGGEVLWWSVGVNYQDLSGTTDDGTVYTARDLGVTDVRVRYDSTDGSSGYLKFFGLNDDGTFSVYDGSGEFGAESGIGVPAEYFADLSGLSDASYSFALELGNFVDGSWARTTMVSEQISYTKLMEDGHISEWTGTYPVGGSSWSPTIYTVVIPEPTSGLLLVVGSALLLLRRKRK